jgi:bile acid:Na+ symporter, BASS family
MDVMDFIQAAVPISLILVVVALGMRSTWADATSLFRAPALLLRSVLAMFVVLPIVAVLIAMSVDLKPPVKVALVVLALSPVPPVLPPKLLKLVSDEAYVYGLLVAASVLSIVLIPLTLTIIGNVIDRDIRVAPELAARTVATSVLLPIGLGLLFRHFWPTAAPRVATVFANVGSLLLVAALIAIIAVAWRGFGALIGDGTLLAFIVFALIALAVGHLLGGAHRDNRTVLALSSAARHPGVAIAIGVALFPDHKKVLVVAVLLYLIVSSITSLPYTRWRKKLHELAGDRAPAPPSTHSSR